MSEIDEVDIYALEERLDGNPSHHHAFVTVGEVRQMIDRIKELEADRDAQYRALAETEQIDPQKPDHIYDKDNWEVTHTPNSFLEEIKYYEPFQVITMGALRKLPDQYAVILDDDGIRGVKWFTRREDAGSFAKSRRAATEANNG